MARKRKDWSNPVNDLERERFRLRIERIKTIPFLDAFDKVALGVSWDPTRVPYHMVCPLPDHFERSGSCYLQKHRWFCFGCHRGGDIIDFAQHYHETPELPKAIKIVERCLGLVNSVEIDESDLALKASIARSQDRPVPTSEWAKSVYEIHDWFLDYTRPFTRCTDPWVSGLAWGYAEEVYRTLDEAAEPRTPRGRRETLKRLWAFAEGWAWGIERDVARITGKDRLDCAIQGWGYPRILTS